MRVMLANAGRLLQMIASGSMEWVNVSIQRQIDRGRQIIKEAGGALAYDERARSAEGPTHPKVESQP